MIVKATTLSSIWFFNLETGEYSRTPRESDSHPHVPYVKGLQKFDTVWFTKDEDGNPAPGVFYVHTGPSILDTVRSTALSVEPVEVSDFEVIS